MMDEQTRATLTRVRDRVQAMRDEGEGDLRSVLDCIDEELARAPIGEIAQCARCSGTGTVEGGSNYYICNECKGSGSVPVPR